MASFTFTVVGKPEPAGSKTSQPVYRKGPDGRPVPVIVGGRVLTNTRDANKKSPGWKDRVAQEVSEQYGPEPLLDVPLAVTFRFVVPRNKGHFGTGRNAGAVKDSAPAYPRVRPDVLKLARGVEDALTGVLWRDDAQIVQEELVKEFGEPSRVEIEVRTLDATVGEQEARMQLALAA